MNQRALRLNGVPAAVCLCAALVVLYAKTLYGMIGELMSEDGQGHGLVILAVSGWLIFRSWDERPTIENDRPMPRLGSVFFVLALALYLLGSQFNVVQFTVASLIPLTVGLVLMMAGPRRLRTIVFPLFFMLFMIPLPRSVADAITQPMKIAVSEVAENILYACGMPISRTGVVLQLGPYQLLVADACAGLYTLFTLESMGLLYLNVVRSSSLLRNVVLAILVVPISFTANVIRVVAICLITYYLGDDAGQGFLHGFAGMVLFLSALMLIIGFDSMLRNISARLERRRVVAA